MAQKRRRDNKSTQKAVAEEQVAKKKLKQTPQQQPLKEAQQLEEQHYHDSSSDEEEEQQQQVYSSSDDDSDSDSDGFNDNFNGGNDSSSDDDDDDEQNDEYDVNQLSDDNDDNDNDNEDDEDDDESEEIMRFQEKHMKKIEHRMPGYHKRLQKEAMRSEEGKQIEDIIPKLPAFDDERTRQQFSENMNRVLSVSIPDRSKWPFPGAKFPVLALAKGKAKQLINVTKETRQADRDRAEKQSENELILNRNHILPSVDTIELEKELRDVATRGVVKLLNQVVYHRRRDDQEEEAVDDYEILRKFTKSGRRK